MEEVIIMDETYILRKISKCKGLIDTAISEDQKEIYQGYLEFWQKKVANEIKAVIEDLTEAQKAEEFELKYPPKKAYYNRDGKTHISKAFKEFLISNQ